MILNEKSKSQEGFSLVETVVCFAILTTAILGAVSVLATNAQLTQDVHFRSLAMYAAMQKMDDILTRSDIPGFAADPNENPFKVAALKNADGTDRPAILKIANPDGSPPDDRVGTIEVVEIEGNAADPNDDMLLVRVTVSWTPPSGAGTASVKLETMLAAP